MHLIDRQLMRAPGRVIQVELTATTRQQRLVDVSAERTLWCLYRLSGVPHSIAIWDVSDDDSIEVPDPPGVSLPPASAPAESAERPRDRLSVVICTRDRPAGLARTLQSLEHQTDRDFDVLVVDNAPTTHPVAGVVGDSDLQCCRYVIESKPGLSRARNKALKEIDADLVAWLDDDEIADRLWIQSIRQGFSHPSDPVAVCGVMLPAELATEAQVRFEQYGGFNKGRELAAAILATDSPTVRSPLYPLPSFGAGGNMAFRVEHLRALGGFDECLGAGTRTHGGEETQVLARLLLRNGTVLHWPAAITWHTHRETMEQLERQFYGYSAGLSAFYVSMLRSEPGTILDVARLVPQGISDLRATRGRGRIGDLPADFPSVLMRASRRGVAAGALAYLIQAASNRWDAHATGAKTATTPQ